MSLAFSEINYLAVLVVGVATFLLGGVWYSALFGKVWVRAHGWSEEKVKEMQAKLSPPLFFGGMLVADLLIALTVALLIVSFNIKSPVHGAVLGLVIWVGPAAAIQFTSQLASDRKIGAYLVDVSYQLLYLVMMGAVLATWR